MTEPRDGDLEQRFEALRSQDARRAPTFAEIVRGRPESRRTPRTVLVMAFAAVVLATVAIWRFVAPDEPVFEIAFTAGEMHVPTDYLLDMMNFPRAGEVPRIGASDWYPLPLPGNAGIDTRRTP